MTIKNRIAKLEGGTRATVRKQRKIFQPRTQAEIDAEKAQSRALYAHLRAIVSADSFAVILQDTENETGNFLAKRFESRDAEIVKADCIELLDYLEARL